MKRFYFALILISIFLPTYTSIELLPKEIIQKIVSFLPLIDIANNTRCVNEYFYNAAENLLKICLKNTINESFFLTTLFRSKLNKGKRVNLSDNKIIKNALAKTIFNKNKPILISNSKFYKKYIKSIRNNKVSDELEIRLREYCALFDQKLTVTKDTNSSLVIIMSPVEIIFDIPEEISASIFEKWIKKLGLEKKYAFVFGEYYPFEKLSIFINELSKIKFVQKEGLIINLLNIISYLDLIFCNDFSLVEQLNLDNFRNETFIKIHHGNFEVFIENLFVYFLNKAADVVKKNSPREYEQKEDKYVKQLKNFKRLLVDEKGYGYTLYNFGFKKNLPCELIIFLPMFLKSNLPTLKNLNNLKEFINSNPHLSGKRNLLEDFLGNAMDTINASISNLEKFGDCNPLEFCKMLKENVNLQFLFSYLTELERYDNISLRNAEKEEGFKEFVDFIRTAREQLIKEDGIHLEQKLIDYVTKNCFEKGKNS